VSLRSQPPNILQPAQTLLLLLPRARRVVGLALNSQTLVSLSLQTAQRHSLVLKALLHLLQRVLARKSAKTLMNTLPVALLQTTLNRFRPSRPQ